MIQKETNYSRKATLIVVQIRRLYTCDESGTVYHNAFLACHHQWIMALGEGDWRKYADDATRIIDARGECVVPAFIETGYESKPQKNYRKTLMDQYARFHNMSENGILTILNRHTQVQYRALNQDVFLARPLNLPSVCYGQPCPKGKFVLTCCGRGDVCSLQPAAFHLRQMERVSSLDLLMAMTAWPAEAAGLTERGILAPGYLADFLVLKDPDLDQFMDRPDTSGIRRMVKNGIPVSPSIIRC